MTEVGKNKIPGSKTNSLNIKKRTKNELAKESDSFWSLQNGILSL